MRCCVPLPKPGVNGGCVCVFDACWARGVCGMCGVHACLRARVCVCACAHVGVHVRVLCVCCVLCARVCVHAVVYALMGVVCLRVVGVREREGGSGCNYCESKRRYASTRGLRGFSGLSTTGDYLPHDDKKLRQKE